MRKYLLYTAILLANSCQPKYEKTATRIECEKFKKGEFLHTSQGDPTIYKIKRNDSIQTEIIGKTGDYVNLRITWTGPCTYELTFLDQHILTGDSISDPSTFKKVKVDIMSVSGDSCFVIVDNGINRSAGVVYIDRK